MSTFPDVSSVQVGVSQIHTLCAGKYPSNESLPLGLVQGNAVQDGAVC